MTTPHSTNITSAASPPNTEIPLITINISAQAPLKLTSTNYLSWKLQFETLFIGYDLIGYIDGSKPCPPHHHHSKQHCHNQSFSQTLDSSRSTTAKCLNCSLSPTIIPFIAQAKTAKKHGPSLPIPMPNPHVVASNKSKPNLRIQQKAARM
ncbi:hypothetical protein CK203_011902 [Vitis vinifera]|uniref:Retrotransposon Copia-like N-terminal domain-containing protein n=1 Tax=Vitis vinifera TaxID=29760 RepID=A0A438K0K8_VITVI|nr:hypothetical protein CK203_011902 [Vitis vinifera]